MNEIVARIDKLRVSKGLTKKKMSKISGIPYSSINNWYYADTYPSIDNIKILCDTFEITIEQFFHGLGNKDSDRQEAEFLDGWRLLTEGEKAAVSAVIAEFKKLRKAVEND